MNVYIGNVIDNYFETFFSKWNDLVHMILFLEHGSWHAFSNLYVKYKQLLHLRFKVMVHTESCGQTGRYLLLHIPKFTWGGGGGGMRGKYKVNSPLSMDSFQNNFGLIWTCCRSVMKTWCRSILCPYWSITP